MPVFSQVANPAFSFLIFVFSYGIPQKLEAATTEEDRAFDVAMKADVQQTKAYLLEEVSELQKLTLERVNFVFAQHLMLQIRDLEWDHDGKLKYGSL